MSAMTNFTLKSLRANRVRTFVTIIGVALAAALLTAVMTSYTSLTDFLYRTEAATSGTWMAMASTDSEAELDAGLANAKDDPSITDIATLRDVGFAELTKEEQQVMGRYQAILSADGNIGDILGIHASEGRMPERAGEVLLFDRWKTDDGIDIGDTITFDVGRRVAKATEGHEDASMESGWSRVGAGDSGVGIEASIEDGTPLSSAMGYLDPETDNGYFEERLIDKEERAYTVVGFYDRVNYALYSGVGTIALTVDEPPMTDFAETFLVMDGVQNSDEVRDVAEEVFPDSSIELHVAMLRFMGIASDTSIWTTFYGLIIILSVVIILACISLIFNAFAISVAERTSQFGLLSSVGATRRQLRRAVILEALIVAVVGVPLGLLIGVGGCAITFAILGPSIAQLAGNGIVPFELKVEGMVIALTVVLTLITVLLSVWIPAKRASSTNIIDSLRLTNGSRVSKRGEKRAQSATDPRKLWRAHGLADRLFGVGGKLALVNRKRGSSKGRTAAISLALAIVLLMTAGSLNAFLSTLVDAATGGYTTAGEVGVTAQFEAQERDLVPPFDAEQLYDADNTQFAKEVDAFEGAYDFLSGSENTIPKGWMLYSTVTATLPADMAGSGLEEDNAGTGIGSRSDEDNFLATTLIYYVDDETFDEYARSLGIDPAEYHDAQDPHAIGIAKGYGNNGSTYLLKEMLKSTGHMDVIASATYMDRYPAYPSIMTESTPEGAMSYVAPQIMEDGDDSVSRKDLTLADVDVEKVGIEVSALADEPPLVVGGNSSYLGLVFPMSVAHEQSFGMTNPIFKSQFDAVDGDHAALAETLSSEGSKYFHDDVPFGLAFYSYNDYISEMDTAQMMATIVNVFCLLFTVILTLIAMANVFNTVTNSLILRRREFAVMRSIGLSTKQFHRMIVDECMHFGIAGLIPGMIVSVFISYLLYSAIGQSMSGLAFTLPWGYVVIAIAMTALAVGISVAYGMRRCKADNVVEALRAE